MYILVVSLCFACTLGAPIDVWGVFKASKGKNFDSVEEEQYRQNVFLSNLEEINRHNKLADEGIYTYWKGINQFTDWTVQEFRDIVLMKPYKVNNTRLLQEESSTDEEVMPGVVDWRIKGAVTPAKEQGFCGSCWAFAAVSVIESAHYIRTGDLEDLSEQQLVDCDHWSIGCRGGWHYWAFDYIYSTTGLVKEKCYRYTGSRGECQYERVKVCAVATCRGSIRFHGERELREHLAFMPVSAGVNADLWMSYKGGIYKENVQDDIKLNHAVAVVGYSDEAYFVKNSWGSDWGENGYIRLARGSDLNTCGIGNDCAIPRM